MNQLFLPRLRRVVAVIGLAAASLTSTVVVAPAAHASTVCTSRSHFRHMYDGTTWPIIGWERMTIEVCTDGDHITTTAASMDDGSTAVADSAGFITHIAQPSRVAFSSGCFGCWGSALYHSDGYTHTCASHWTEVFCSYAEHFRITGSVRMEPWYYTARYGDVRLAGRLFHWYWGNYCTNSLCRVGWTS